MKTIDVENSFRAWWEQELQVPEKFADRVHTHWRGEPYTDNQALLLVPRLRGFDRSGPRDGDMEFVDIEVTVALKQDPGQLTFGLLSLLVDQVRKLIDSTRRDDDGDRPAACGVVDREGRVHACMDFGPAQETRAEGQTIQVGGVAVGGVDSAVLAVRAQLSPIRPTVRPRT